MQETNPRTIATMQTGCEVYDEFNGTDATRPRPDAKAA